MLDHRESPHGSHYHHGAHANIDRTATEQLIKGTKSERTVIVEKLQK